MFDFLSVFDGLLSALNITRKATEVCDSNDDEKKQQPLSKQEREIIAKHRTEEMKKARSEMTDDDQVQMQQKR